MDFKETLAQEHQALIDDLMEANPEMSLDEATSLTRDAAYHRATERWAYLKWAREFARG